MTINLTTQELGRVIDVLGEYIEVMGEAEDTHYYTDYMLDTGLGSALHKLCKNRRVQSAYKYYPHHRENFSYPSFEEWLEKQEVNE